MSRAARREEARLDSPSMTAGGAPIKARGCPPIFFENRLPPRPLRGASACAPAALTDAPPPVRQTPFSMVRTKRTEVVMGMVQSIGTASDRVLETLKAGREIEFGPVAGEDLAQRFLEAVEMECSGGARGEGGGGGT